MISTIDRRRIYIFVAIAYAIAIGLGVVIYFSGGLIKDIPFKLKPLATTLMMVTMFGPMVANIATRLITREGWSNTLLRPNFRRGWLFYLAAWFLPSLAVIVGGGLYYLLFPSRFDLSMAYSLGIGMLPAERAGDPLTLLVILIALGPWPAVILGFAEEFGWRAYLLQKLMPLGPRKALLVLGAIWGAWHWPAVFMGYEYGFHYWGAPVVGPLLWLVICFVLGTFLAWLTLRSGSVWPAALGHSAINATAWLMAYFVSQEPDWLIGPLPVGIIGALGYAVLAVLILLIPGALAPTAGPRPSEPKAVQQAAPGAAS